MRSLYFQMTPEGKLPQGIKDALGKLLPEFAGKKIRFHIEEALETTSDKQRRYYFGVIVVAFQEYFAKQGKVQTKDQLHDSMMRYIGGFSNSYVDPFTGEPDAGRLSYNDLTKKQAEGYHHLCRIYAGQVAKPSFDVPEPNEYMWREYAAA